MATDRKYAVAIRDGNRLFWHLRITRHLDGDVYVITVADRAFRRRAAKASYHASGRIHVKSYGCMVFPPRHGPPPDANFQGVQTFWGTALAGPFQIRCNPANFDDVFEIPMTSVSPDIATCRTHIEVSLVGKDDQPIAPDLRCLLWHRRFFKDRLPWIVVSVYDWPALVVPSSAGQGCMYRGH
jgi:hypothetical protein